MTRPPVLLRWLLQGVLRSDDAAMVVPDLDDLYLERRRRDGGVRAKAWYARQVAGCMWRLGICERRGLNATSVSTHDKRHREWSESWRELRIIARSMWRSRGYALTVVLALSLGVAAVTTVYSVANWVLLRALPGVQDPAHLAIVQLELGNGGAGPGGGGFPFSHPDAVALTDRARYLATFTAVTSQELHFAADRSHDAARIPAQFVWPNYFAVLGTRLQVGRSFDNDSLERLVVVSDRLARQYWGNVRQAVGASVVINGMPYTVAGVTPSEFHGADLPGATDLWIASSSMPSLLHDPSILTNVMGQVWSTVIARPRAGVTAKQIADAMNDGVKMIRQSSPVMSLGSFHGYDGAGPSVYLRDNIGHTLRIIGIAAMVLLLLTCANAANLGLARAVSRSGDASIRRALGARASQVLRERMMESVVLGAAAACASVVLVAGALRALRQFTLMRGAVSLEGIRLEPVVLVVAFIAAMLAAIVSGFIPALIASRNEASLRVRSGAQGDRATNRLRGALVIAQMALSIVLVVSAGLFGRTLWNLRNIDFGFDQRSVTQFSLDPEMQGYDEVRTTALMRNLISDLEARPDVRGAALMDHGVFDHFTFPAAFIQPGTERSPRARSVQMSPGLPQVLGIRLIAGREFGADWLTGDTSAGRVGMLNETAANVLFPGVAPAQVVGRTVQMRGGREPETVLITGVVSNARLSSIENRDSLTLYQPWSQGFKTGQFTVFVRSRDVNTRLDNTIRDVVHRLDATLPVYGIRTLAQDVDEQISEQRLIARLALALACTGIVLAMLGVYGSLSYLVHERKAEMGVRSALGARPAELLAGVVQNGLTLSMAGVIIGIVLAFNFSRVLAARLYGVTPFDGLTYVAGGAAVLFVAVIASAIPGWRAARVDPLTALRQE